MSLLFWKSTPDAHTEADIEHGRGRTGDVNEQHPLPMQMAWLEEGATEWTGVDEAHPMPVQILEPLNPGYDTDFQTALNATLVAIKAGPGRLYGFEASSGDTVSNWIQVFDLGIADITLGTTAPKFSLLVPKGASPTDAGAMDKLWTAGIKFDKAISIAATTAPDNGTGAVVALDVNTFFR